MLFAQTYSVSIKRPVALQSTSAFVRRFMFVSVVSISTSMSNEVVLSEEMMYLLGRHFSQCARWIRSHFGGLEGEGGRGGESCTSFTQSDSSEESFSIVSTDRGAYRLCDDSRGIPFTHCDVQNPSLPCFLPQLPRFPLWHPLMRGGLLGALPSHLRT